MSGYKEKLGRVNQTLKDKVAQASFKDFFMITGLGIGIGLIMAFGDDIMTYTISLTLSCTVVATAFIMFALPRLIGSMKPTPSPLSIGDTIAIGEDGDRPRVSSKNKLRTIQPEF